MRRSRILVLGVALAACGGRGGAGHAPDAAPVSAADAGLGADFAAELEPLPLGLANVGDFGYAQGVGQKFFRKALAARERGDWATVRLACEQAIAADPGHLEAHRTLASALAALHVDAGVARHLSVALAGDFLRWGPGWDRDPTLGAYLAGAHGARVRELVAGYRGEYLRRVQKGLLLVARRQPVRALRLGVQDVLLRAEVFAWDPETARFLRVTRTNLGVAGWLRSPSGDQIAWVAYTKVRVGEGGQARLVDPRVGAVDLLAPAMSPRNVKLDEVPAVRLEFDARGRLYATTGDLEGADRKLARTWQLDVLAGRARKGTPGSSGAGRQLLVTAEGARVAEVAPAGVEADWAATSSTTDAAAGAFRLSSTRKTVTLPTGAYARRGSFVWSPGGARVAFATRAEACAADAAARRASLYVVDAATGRLRVVAQGERGLAAAWLDDDRLAYEDGEGGLRVVDVTSGAEVAQLAAPGGLGLGGLAPRARCLADAAPDDAPGDEPPEPPEE